MLTDFLHRIYVFSAIVAMVSSLWVAAWANQEASLVQQGWWPALPHKDYPIVVTPDAPIVAETTR